jgi:hypothetical protein
MMRRARVPAAAALAAAAAAVPVSASAGTLAPERGTAPVPARHAGLLLHWAGGDDWMGSFDDAGRIVICLSPGKILTAPVSWRTGQWGSKAESAELSWLYANGGNGPNTRAGDITAAAARIDMLKLTGGLGYYRHLDIPAAVAAEMGRLSKAMEADSGPYTRSLAVTRPTTTPGQAGAVQMNVVSASGHAVTGYAAVFTPVAGASIGTDGRTGRPQPFTETSSPVRITASTRVASGDLRIGSAGEAFQTLVYGLTAGIGASATFRPHPAAVMSSVACQCDGTGTGTSTVTQAAGSDPARYVEYANGKPAAFASLPGTGHSASAVFRTAAGKLPVLPDGTVVTFTASYRADGHWTAPVALGGEFTVICPPVPKLTQECLCDVTLTLADPFPAGSPYTEDLAYTVGGTTRTVPVAGGTTRTVTFSITSGRVTYQAVVERGGVVVASTPRMAGGFA